MRFLRRARTATRPRVEDHREYVGGYWDEIGRLQFEFLVDRGLRPQNVLLDVACGSLRGGVHFIRYLEPGNYLGIDQEQRLIDAGLEHELDAADRLLKQPEFVVSSTFEFHRFSKRPDYAIAQSLFSHLTAGDIRRCLENLRAFVTAGHTFFATFNEGDAAGNPAESDPWSYFAYSRADLRALAAETGWRATYVGEWGHPRGQRMMLFEPEGA